MSQNSAEIFFDVSLDGQFESVRIHGPSKDSSFAVAMIEQENEYPVRNLNLSGFTVIDIGAGYGEFSALCYLLGAVSQIGFEPNAEVFQYLEKNLGFLPSVELHQKAVFSTSGESILFYRDTGSASGSISEVQYDPLHLSAQDRSIQPVETTGISDLLRGVRGPYVLKIDAEGVEYDLVESAAEGNLLSGCRLLFIEYHRGTQRLVETLEQKGFSVEIEQKDSEMGLISARKQEAAKLLS